MRKFDINNEYEAICEWKKTRNGFKHEATLLRNGEEVARAKECYLNRTWESYEYETVLRKLLKNTSILSEKETTDFLENGRRKEHERVDKTFSTISMVAKIGEVLCDSKKDANDWKKRMISAGLPEVTFPSDWEELCEEEKERRMNEALAVRT